MSDKGMMYDGLIRCPFCHVENTDTAGFIAHKRDCYLMLRWMQEKDKNKLRKAWNTRPNEDNLKSERDQLKAENGKLRAENERLREALSSLYEACMKADELGDLSECIDGSLLDAAQQALNEVTK